MKRGIFFILVIGFLLALPVCSPRNVLATGTAGNTYRIPPSAISASASGWPCQFWSDKSSYTVFTPQVDSWDGHSLVARSAVYVQAIGKSRPTYGVITFKAITLVDKTTHEAALKEVEITNADFPSAPGRQADLLKVLKLNSRIMPRHFPWTSWKPAWP